MDAIFHVMVPLLFLLLVGTNKKRVLALLPLGILPDLGRFFYIRKGLHSFFFVFLVLMVIYLLNHATRKGREMKSVIAIAAFYLFSHLLLDLGAYMALFYPFSDTTYALQARIVLVDLFPRLVLGVSSGGLGELEQGIGGILSEPGLGILLMVVMVVAYFKIKRKEASK